MLLFETPCRDPPIWVLWPTKTVCNSPPTVFWPPESPRLNPQSTELGVMIHHNRLRVIHLSVTNNDSWVWFSAIRHNSRICYVTWDNTSEFFWTFMLLVERRFLNLCAAGSPVSFVQVLRISRSLLCFPIHVCSQEILARDIHNHTLQRKWMFTLMLVSLSNLSLQDTWMFLG